MSAPLLDLGSRNLIINGGAHFFQRWLTTNNTLATTGFFIGDRFAMFVSGTTPKTSTVSQSSSVPADITGRVGGSFQVTSTSNFTPTGNDRWTPFLYQMEGLDYAPWHLGKNMALTFYMWAPVAGDYSVYLTNIDGTRKQVRTVNISAGEVSTWVRRSILFTTDTIGTWNLNNQFSFEIGFFTIGSGTQLGGAVNSWSNSVIHNTTPTCVNWAATNGNLIRLAGIQLHGYSGKYYERLFQIRGAGLAEELRLCQRYYERGEFYYRLDWNPGAAVTAAFNNSFAATKRITPTGSIAVDNSSGALSAASVISAATTQISIATTMSNSGATARTLAGIWAANAEGF